jgi:hypothetical protein
MIQLAKLALWALQDDCVASAWRPYDSHVCGAVANKHRREKKTKKMKNRAQPRHYPPSKPEHPRKASKPTYLPSSQIRLARSEKRSGSVQVSGARNSGRSSSKRAALILRGAAEFSLWNLAMAFFACDKFLAGSQVFSPSP